MNLFLVFGIRRWRAADFQTQIIDLCGLRWDSIIYAYFFKEKVCLILVFFDQQMSVAH